MSQSNFDQWAGVVRNRRVHPDTSVVAILKQAKSGSFPFLALANDEKKYWVKMIRDGAVGKLPIVEVLVSGCGRLIGAPVCETAIVEIPSLFAGQKLPNGLPLTTGLAHGSLSLDNALESKWPYPDYVRNDNNARRHPGYFAIYDWCWGCDVQWLHDASNDYSVYSHDHGLFLKQAWTREVLEPLVAISHELWATCRGLDDNEFKRLAAELESVTPQSLISVLEAVPESWPVTNEELEMIGAFLSARAKMVAERMRQLADKV